LHPDFGVIDLYFLEPGTIVLRLHGNLMSQVRLTAFVQYPSFYAHPSQWLLPPFAFGCFHQKRQVLGIGGPYDHITPLDAQIPFVRKQDIFSHLRGD
jgi:hypothetical protein